MANESKYNIIETIKDDPEYKNQLWITMAFLSPDKIDKTKFLDVRGFKIFSCYASYESAEAHANELEKTNTNHDIYIGQMGKLLSWDDLQKASNIQHKDKKLNELDRTYRENADKAKLYNEQVKDDQKMKINANINQKKVQTVSRLRKQLLKSGQISRTEYEELKRQEKLTSINEHRSNVEDEIVRMNEEMKQCADVDYLDETSSNYKYGIVSFYTKARIVNLKEMCFKVRGMFNDQESLMKRVTKLQKENEHDQIIIYEVGKWCGQSDTVTDNALLNVKLNYLMKMYLDDLKLSKENYEKRKADMIVEMQQDNKRKKHELEVLRKKAVRRGNKPEVLAELDKQIKKAEMEENNANNEANTTTVTDLSLDRRSTNADGTIDE